MIREPGAAKKRVAVLISGRGSNLEAIAKAAENPEYPARIVGVLSNKPDAAGLEFARSRNMATAVVRLKDHESKAAADSAITAQLEAWNVDIVCLAGFMRLLSPAFCRQWEGRLINIHPSILPAYKGLDTHRRALEAGDTVHGCSVHFVTSEMDDGPIIGQVIVPIRRGDTSQRLAERVLKAEHQLYPWVIAQLASDEISYEDLRGRAGSLAGG